MNALRIVFLSLFLSISSLAVAVPRNSSSQFSDYDFEQEKMILSPDSVLVISSFEADDHITTYTYYGDRLWDKAFHAKIVSWQLVGDYVFVFSKHRDGKKTYITCMDRHTGNLIWQKP